MAAEDSSRRARERRDSTADLPTSILALILSLHPLRIALICASISKPWLAAVRELLATAADLDLGKDFAEGMPVERYCSLVKSALELRQGTKTLNTLKIFFRVGSPAQLACAEALLEMAALQRSRELDLELVLDQHFRKNFLDLVIDQHVRRNLYYSSLSEHTWVCTSTPHCWRSLTRLSLVWEGQDHLAPLDYLSLDPRLDVPVLQMLSLQRVQVTAFLASLFDGCPLLSTVKLTECSWTNGLKISSLQISSLELFQCKTWKGSFHLDAPALRSFYSYGHEKCIFLENAVSLADVYICSIWGPQTEGIYRNDEAENWCPVAAVDHVSTLTLCEYALLELMDREALKITFCNLQTLQLILLDEPALGVVIDFMQDWAFPVLENLFIEFAKRYPYQYNVEQSNWKIPVVPLGLLRLVSIRGFAGVGAELKIIEFFLANAASLEILVVRIDNCIGPHYEDELVTLQMMLEASPKASKSAKIFVCCDADDVGGVPPPPHADFHSKGFGCYLKWSKAYYSTAEA